MPTVFTKGAPEIISKLCDQKSLPSNFLTVHEKLTKKGYRILALAKRSFDLQLHKVLRLKREEVETELEFLGLLVFNNNVKNDTAAVIAELSQLRIFINKHLSQEF